jgi:hypothetical protein
MTLLMLRVLSVPHCYASDAKSERETSLVILYAFFYKVFFLSF